MNVDLIEQISTLGEGTYVHQTLGADFVGSGGITRYRSNSRLANYYSIAYILGRFNITGIPNTEATRSQPDLTDLQSYDVYEIKPDNSYYRGNGEEPGVGPEELSDYLYTLDTYDTQNHAWRQGLLSTYTAPQTIPNPYNGGVFDIRQPTDNLSGPYSQTGMIYYSSQNLEDEKAKVAQAVLQITVVTYTLFALATAVVLIEPPVGLVLFAEAESVELTLAEQIARLEASYAAASAPASEAPAAAVELGEYLSAQRTPVGVNLVFSAVLEDPAFVTNLHASPTKASQPTILSDAPTPTPTTLGGTSDPRLGPIVQEAEAAWGPGDGNRTPSINFVVAPLSGGLLAESVVTSWDAEGRPASGVVFLSPDADGAGWYIDPTLSDHTSFAESLSAMASAAQPGSAAYGHYDLLTTLEHEIGHILAFNPTNPGYASHLQTINGSQVFVGPGFTVPVAPGGELDPSLYPDDVMSGTLDPGVRKLVSNLDLDVVSSVWGGNLNLPITTPVASTPAATTTVIDHAVAALGSTPVATSPIASSGAGSKIAGKEKKAAHPKTHRATIKVKHPEIKHSPKVSTHRVVKPIHAKAPSSKTKHTPEAGVAVALSGRGVIVKAKPLVSEHGHPSLSKHD